MSARFLTMPVIGQVICSLTGYCIPARGLVMDGKRIKNTISAMLFWNLYESAEARFILRYLRTDLPVIELGSSIGFISCLIRRKLPKHLCLVCVEANPTLIDTIHAHLNMNGLHHNVFVINRAIYYGQTEVGLKFNTSSLDTQVDPTVSDGIIKTTSLLSLLHQHTIHDPYVLVMDIEGAEAGILLHDGPTLQNCQQIIAEFEDSDLFKRKFSVQNMIDQLNQQGFELKARYGNVCLLERT